jgi:hypothetical protein
VTRIETMQPLNLWMMILVMMGGLAVIISFFHG